MLNQRSAAAVAVALACFFGASSCASGGSSDLPFVNTGSNTISESNELYLATFRHLIRTERWVGTDYICVGIGPITYDPQAPPGRIVSRLSAGTTRVVPATGCSIGRSFVQHRTTRNQAQLIVVNDVQTTSDGAEAQAYQFTTPQDQERFRCRLVRADGEWRVERCESRRL